MEKGDIVLVLVILILIVVIALLTMNMDKLFPTPTVKDAITAINTT